MSDIDERALESVVKQFRGGEHALAGKRASQLVYGTSAKPDEAFLARLREEAPGIERYVSADGITPPAGDQGGDPLATQPENDPHQNDASNLSDDKAKREQAEIDDRLAAGREAQEKRAEGNEDADVGETKLDPDTSDKGNEKPASSELRGRRKPGA